MRRLLTPAQVGELIGVSDDTARRYMRDEMNCIELQRGWLRVEEAELERWCNRRRTAPAEAKPGKPRRKAAAYDPELFEPDGRIKRRRGA